MFFVENDRLGQRIDYAAAVSGSLKLVPVNEAYKALNVDYDAMVEAGLLVRDDAYLFDDVMERCRTLELRANKRL
jgi:6,7-dimethyl-8-ribityllumazine synthase